MVLHTGMTLEELTGFFRARVQVRLPDDRVTWLRLADATVVARLANAGALLPVAFWHRVSNLSYDSGQPAIQHYQPARERQGHQEFTGIEGTAVIQPCFRFSEALVQTLSNAQANTREKAPDNPDTDML